MGCLSLSSSPRPRVPLFGLRGLADRLDDRFSILTKGRRTAVPRHQTLGAMIDWSYEGLSDSEKTVWRRLSVFCSSFTIEAADAIANDGSANSFCMVDVLDDLLQKSLILSDKSGDETRYRLLESLRLYAFTKLQGNQEAERIRRRHAQYWYEHTVGSADNWIEVPDADWIAKHSGDIADLRAALDWAFAPGGDPVLGVRIAAGSAPMWFKMLLLPELRRYLEAYHYDLGRDDRDRRRCAHPSQCRAWPRHFPWNRPPSQTSRRL